ncbi:hypothetical protein L3V83_15275 [Thiotrichales bacterium 19X7-9]|nr:hypothetical protein [Thiotrichales bacterium 19X7-9]
MIYIEGEIKTKESLKRKINNEVNKIKRNSIKKDNKKDYTINIVDIFRGLVVLKPLKDGSNNYDKVINSFIEGLQKNGYAVSARSLNYPDGYNAIHLNIKLGNQHTHEIQIMDEAMLYLKDETMLSKYKKSMKKKPLERFEKDMKEATTIFFLKNSDLLMKMIAANLFDGMSIKSKEVRRAYDEVKNAVTSSCAGIDHKLYEISRDDIQDDSKEKINELSKKIVCGIREEAGYGLLTLPNSKKYMNQDLHDHVETRSSEPQYRFYSHKGNWSVNAPKNENAGFNNN